MYVCCVTIILLTLDSWISIQLTSARVQTLISHSFNLQTLAMAEENDMHSDNELCPPSPSSSSSSSSIDLSGSGSIKLSIHSGIECSHLWHQNEGGAVNQSEDVLLDARYRMSTEYIAHEGSILQVGSSAILVLYLLKMSWFFRMEHRWEDPEPPLILNSLPCWNLC